MYKEKLVALLNGILAKWGRDDDVFDIINDGLEAFGNYVISVYNMETRITILRFRTEDPSEFQDEVMRLDQARRNAHEAAIAMSSAINRIAKQLSVDVLCPETDDRNVIAEFCADITMEFFKRGQDNKEPLDKKEVKEFVDSLT